MSLVGTKKEFEALADYILTDYLGTHDKIPRPINIIEFAEQYLKMELSYKIFKDQSIAGMTYGRNIVLDERLRAEGRTGEHNFTLAHECGHELINQQDENYQPGKILKYRIQRTRKVLVTDEDFGEWQANVVAAYLLMPPDLIEWCMFTFRQSKPLPLFGEAYLYRRDLMTVRNIMDYLGVSKTALLIRLSELGYVEHKPLSEFDYCMDSLSLRGVI